MKDSIKKHAILRIFYFLFKNRGVEPVEGLMGFIFYRHSLRFFLQGVKKLDKLIVPKPFHRMSFFFIFSPIPCEIRVIKIFIRLEPSWHETWYDRMQEPKAWTNSFENSEED